MRENIKKAPGEAATSQLGRVSVRKSRTAFLFPPQNFGRLGSRARDEVDASATGKTERARHVRTLFRPPTKPVTFGLGRESKPSPTTRAIQIFPQKFQLSRSYGISTLYLIYPMLSIGWRRFNERGREKLHR